MNLRGETWPQHSSCGSKRKAQAFRFWTNKRIKNAIYDTALRNVSGVTLPKNRNLFDMSIIYMLRVPDRDFALSQLEKNMIEYGIHYPIALPKPKHMNT